jgi:aminoglycoside/choline kinase family phosphotransferase
MIKTSLSAFIKTQDIHKPYPGIHSIEVLKADVSLKKFYRIQLQKETLILMLCDPQTLKSTLDTYAFLRKAQIRVPEIKETFQDPNETAVIFEDCGDQKFLDKIGRCDIHQTKALYEQAIEILVQLKAFWEKNPQEGFTQRFDVTKLMSEVEMTTHQVETLYQKKLLPEDKKALHDFFEKQCQDLQKEPFILCHRDFHSRNIMVQNEECIVIDYQDARLGPASYDLCSLLKDSYTLMPEEMLSSLLEKYQKHFCAQDFLSYQKSFCQMSLQRNYKAIGSFCFAYNTQKNPFFLKYIGSTFESMKITLQDQYPEIKKILLSLYNL